MLEAPHEKKVYCFEPMIDDLTVPAEMWILQHPPSWVIVGGLTGPGAAKRPPPVDSILHIVQICQDMKIPVLVKDNARLPGAPKEYPHEY